MYHKIVRKGKLENPFQRVILKSRRSPFSPSLQVARKTDALVRSFVRSFVSNPRGSLLLLSFFLSPFIHSSFSTSAAALCEPKCFPQVLKVSSRRKSLCLFVNIASGSLAENSAAFLAFLPSLFYGKADLEWASE